MYFSIGLMARAKGKYSIGWELREQARRIIGLIIQTNSLEDKTPLLRDLATTC